MDNQELLQLAKQAAEYAYAPYSHFCVGAALLCENGKVFTGCNIENATYGATCCAERVAVGKAISEGERAFTKIAVVSLQGEMTPPCGICRQVLLEFMPSGQVVLENGTGGFMVFGVRELLPFGFELEAEK